MSELVQQSKAAFDLSIRKCCHGCCLSKRKHSGHIYINMCACVCHIYTRRRTSMYAHGTRAHTHEGMLSCFQLPAPSTPGNGEPRTLREPLRLPAPCPSFSARAPGWVAVVRTLPGDTCSALRSLALPTRFSSQEDLPVLQATSTAAAPECRPEAWGQAQAPPPSSVSGKRADDLAACLRLPKTSLKVTMAVL